MICSSAAICSFGWRALLKAAINSSACDMPSPRIWIGSVFFAGREKAPLALSAFFVDSHHRFHSVSVKLSPTIHSWICSAVAFPSKLSSIQFCRGGNSPSQQDTAPVAPDEWSRRNVRLAREYFRSCRAPQGMKVSRCDNQYLLLDRTSQRRLRRDWGRVLEVPSPRPRV